MALLALYGLDNEHPPGCTCAGCTVTLADSPLSVAWRKIPADVVNDYLDAVYSQSITRTDLHEGLFREYFDRLKRHAEAGWGKRFRDAADLPEWEFFQKMERNLRDFAGHKQAVLTEQLRLMMTDKSGNKLSRADWEKATAKTVKRHNDRYLRIETQMATQSAQAAESWQHFERRAYLYPNLKYETAGDERVRESHRSLDGTVRPVNDPFWDVYYPPNGWHCRCKVIQTDEAVTPGDGVDFDPPKGFRGNVGKTGKIFGDDHPYFDQSALDGERIERNAKLAHAKLTRGEVREWAKSELVPSFSASLPGLPQPVALTNREIRNITGKSHHEPASRNELLYVLPLIFDRLQYIGKAADDGKHSPVAQWFYYRLLIGELEYFFNFWQVQADANTTRVGLGAIYDTFNNGP